MAKLVLYLPDGSLHDILLDKERLTIGRRADNDICLPFPAVSGEHAVVVTILADSFLEDLNSTNGTLVNGKPVAKHFLRDNDLIDIGRQRLVYFSRDDVQAKPLTPETLRREVRGLHDQVERVSEEEKPKAADPARGGATGAVATGAGENAGDASLIVDPLIPDDELMADFDVGVLPGSPKQPPAPAPATPPATSPSPARRPVAQPSESRSGRSSSTVASRLASTWTPDGTEPESRPREPAPREDVPSASPPRKTTVRTRVADPRQPPDPEVALPGFRVRVLTGPNEGRDLPLTRPEMAVGRVGTQVARLRCDAAGWRLSSLEGSEAPELNGKPISPAGAVLAPGDRIRVAETELVFERP